MTKVALLDYGMGNLHSVAKALSRVGADVSLTCDPRQVAKADKIVFPGVGAMRDCMAGMVETGIDEMVRQMVFNKPMMALCVGMQALFDESEENDGTTALGILSGHVRRFDDNCTNANNTTFNNTALKVPHMGWNTIYDMDLTHSLWQNIHENTHFYFIHSYYCQPNDANLTASTCDYGQPFCASIIKDNLFDTQIHPEKSHTAGLQLLKNFVDWQT